MIPMDLTIDIARAAAQDAGDRSARKAGRAQWNQIDWNVAVETFNRLWPESREERR